MAALQRNWTGAQGVALAAVLTLAPFNTACAQQAPETTQARPVAIVTTSSADTGLGSPHAAPATFNTAGAVTTEASSSFPTASRRDAAIASRPDNGGGISLHIGDGVEIAASTHRLLNEQGIRTVAFTGGPDNEVEAFVKGRRAGTYSFSEVARTEMAHALICIYDANMCAIQVASNACHADQQTMLPADVASLSHNCDAIIFYGSDVSAYQAQGEAGSLRNVRKYNVIAVQGFPVADQISVVMNGRIEGGRTFSEDDMLVGQVGSLIMREMGHPSTVQTAQVTDATSDCVAEQQTMLPADVASLSQNCDAIIFYGSDVSDFQIRAQVGALRDEPLNYNVIAVQGFPTAGEIAVVMNGRIEGGRTFSETDMRRGQVGSLIMREMGHSSTVGSNYDTGNSLNNSKN